MTLNAINSLALQYDFPIFGGSRTIDFSQFKVRGHYDESDRLRRYFRTMKWLGRTDLRLATFPPNHEEDIRQLGTAIVLAQLLNQSGQFNNWSALERVTRVFVGTTDSMTFAQLNDLLTCAHINSLADIPNLTTLTNLQTRLMTGELGVQSIHSDFFYSPLGRAQVKLPRSFTVCGQKFVEDSWAFSQVVFDRVLWGDDQGNTFKVIRRKPSCLDVAFSVFGNDQIVPELAARITDVNGVAFRDGLPYQHNLQAVRNVIDRQDSGIWTNNIYNAWLAALRSLSTPTTDSRYPEAMRTRAWAMKTVNSQLGSWTELRHDTLLYAKQSYTEPILCSYPTGFVEPRVEFWGHMQQLANVAADSIAELPLSGQVRVPNHDPVLTMVTYDLGSIKMNEIAFLGHFATQIATLQAISEKDLAQEPLSAGEIDYLESTVQMYFDNYFGVTVWDGWYPKLYYHSAMGFSAGNPCDTWDPQVADVHTDLPDPFVGDPGAVIHEALGNVNLLLIAVDNGPDRMIYAGPVLSHYEFEVGGLTVSLTLTGKAG